MIDDPSQWQRAKEIVADALELAPSARDGFLQRACGPDETLLREVCDLLQTGAATETAATASAGPFAREGRRIGPYVLQHPIGRGGIGQVWAATRTDDVRLRVAIKLLRGDREDDEQFLQRFRAEMQILALMQHPNIVTFLDAGVTVHGQPYFAMEYVEGEPINAYCNRRRLSVQDRLRLFLQVCDAVQHAHRYALLHRDLKPGNILVTGEGTVKLLDFGIAKMLRPEMLGSAGILTRPDNQPMTPEYASPEQLLGGVLTTASDIYSLGVVLFATLTNRTPFSPQKKDLLEFRELVARGEPPPPSTTIGPDTFQDFRAPTATRLRKELRGELDNIVLKAIRREPDRRYATVAELADDIRRRLDGLPVKAQPESTLYLLGKFVRRRRIEVLAAVAVVLSLAVGLGEAVRERNVARSQRDLAEARLGHVRMLAQSFENTFRSLEEAGRPGSSLRVGLAEATQQSALQPESRDLQENLARSYEVIAEALGRNGQTTDAERMAKKAVALRETLAASFPGDRQAAAALSSARTLLAKILAGPSTLGSVPSASGSAPVVEASIAVARGYEQLGEMLRLTGDAAGAIRAYSAAAAELGLAAPSPESRAWLARLYGELAELYSAAGDRGKAEQYRRASARLQQPTVPARYSHSELR
jgi:serine/threonine protein kinase